MEEHKNDMFEDLEQILSVKQGIFYNFPYQANGEWIQDAFWYDKPDDTLWEEKLDNMIDYYPKLHASLIDRSSELNNDLLYHLNVELISKIELPRSIDPYYASFVLFPARENILAQIGIIMKAPHPNSRNVLKYQIDDFVIAEICHIDFDKYKDYKPKRNECHYDYLRRLIRGARGNRGFITVNDSFEILVARSKASWPHDFQKARCYYFECLYKKSNQENAQLIQNEQLTLDTMMKDLGYDASKFLDEKYKVTNRRPSRQFSDPLFVQFRETWTDLQWKKKRTLLYNKERSRYRLCSKNKWSK
eukprot:971906_1